MIRFIILSAISILILSVFTGCHAAQEKAWETTMEITRQKISEDEFLSKNIDHIELERRQFIRVYIVNQKARSNFAKITFQVTQIAGEALYAEEGNRIKELMVFGALVDGDEVIVAKYTKESGAEIMKDRSMHTM